MNEKEICDECYKCKYYTQNTDEGWDCIGQDKPCHEFIKVKEQNSERT